MIKRFKTPAQMESLINMYFAHVENFNKLEGYMRPSIEGLAHHLDLTKSELLEYTEDPLFEDLVSMGVLRIEADLELRTRLDEPDVEGVMADLVNDFGWEPLDEGDRQQIMLMVN